jgi:hypothetical protein
MRGRYREAFGVRGIPALWLRAPAAQPELIFARALGRGFHAPEEPPRSAPISSANEVSRGFLAPRDIRLTVERLGITPAKSCSDLRSDALMPTIAEQIRECAFELLKGKPEGLRFGRSATAHISHGRTQHYR